MNKKINSYSGIIPRKELKVSKKNKELNRKMKIFIKKFKKYEKSNVKM